MSSLFLLVDSSEWCRNEDYSPNRLQAQALAARLCANYGRLVCGDGSIATLRMTKAKPDVLSTLQEFTPESLDCLSTLTLKPSELVVNPVTALSFIRLLLLRRANSTASRLTSSTCSMRPVSSRSASLCSVGSSSRGGSSGSDVRANAHLHIVIFLCGELTGNCRDAGTVTEVLSELMETSGASMRLDVVSFGESHYHTSFLRILNSIHLRGFTFTSQTVPASGFGLCHDLLQSPLLSLDLSHVSAFQLWQETFSTCDSPTATCTTLSPEVSNVVSPVNPRRSSSSSTSILGSVAAAATATTTSTHARSHSHSHSDKNVAVPVPSRAHSFTAASTSKVVRSDSVLGSTDPETIRSPYLRRLLREKQVQVYSNGPGIPILGNNMPRNCREDAMRPFVLKFYCTNPISAPLLRSVQNNELRPQSYYRLLLSTSSPPNSPITSLQTTAVASESTATTTAATTATTTTAAAVSSTDLFCTENSTAAQPSSPSVRTFNPSTEILHRFRGGRSFRLGRQRVVADPRKGEFIVLKPDSHIHWLWRDRETKVVEEDIKLAANEIEFECLQPSSQTYALHYRHRTKCMLFYMQDPHFDASILEDIVAAVNCQLLSSSVLRTIDSTTSPFNSPHPFPRSHRSHFRLADRLTAQHPVTRERRAHSDSTESISAFRAARYCPPYQSRAIGSTLLTDADELTVNPSRNPNSPTSGESTPQQQPQKQQQPQPQQQQQHRHQLHHHHHHHHHHHPHPHPRPTTHQLSSRNILDIRDAFGDDDDDEHDLIIASRLGSESPSPVRTQPNCGERSNTTVSLVTDSNVMDIVRSYDQSESYFNSERSSTATDSSDGFHSPTPTQTPPPTPSSSRASELDFDVDAAEGADAPDTDCDYEC